jgi:hypothetical protein
MSCDSQIKYKDKKKQEKNQESNKSINVTYLFLNTYFYIDRLHHRCSCDVESDGSLQLRTVHIITCVISKPPSSRGHHLSVNRRRAGQVY